MVICSRLHDYQALSTRLKLQSAICIQPLKIEQVHQYLEKAGEQLESLKLLVEQDTTLLELAKSPLMLNIMTLAYQGKKAPYLPRTTSVEEYRKNFFDTYIQSMFEIREIANRYPKYPKEKVICWLIWLAQKMSHQSQPIFLIERMQPAWLQTPLGKCMYCIGVGLSYGLAFGFSFGLAAAWSYGIITGLFIAIIFGLAFGVSAWLTVVGSIDQIIKLIVDLIAKVIDKLLGRESINQNDTETITTKIPNQEIKETIRSALIWGVIGALLGGVMSLIGIDPIELRIINDPPQDPEKNLPWSSRSLVQCLREGAKRFGWEKRNPKPRSMKDGRYLIGYGVASATYPANRQPATARTRILQNGSVLVQIAATDIGTGTYTILTQTAAEALGVSQDLVQVEIGDTQLPPSPGSGGSWGVASYGSAVHECCLAARDKVVALVREDTRSSLKGLSSSDLEARAGGIFSKGDSSQGETYQEILTRNNSQFANYTRQVVVDRL